MNIPVIDDPEIALFARFGAALLIGLLIGLQREYAHGNKEEKLFAGVRTFSLIALSGCAAAYLSQQVESPLVFIALLLALGALTLAAYLRSANNGDIGLTTEVAALVTLLCGAICIWGSIELAAAIGVVTTVMLSLKLEMHTFARRLTREDVYASLTFAVISIVVLPLLPNRSFAPQPFDVLNLYSIWLMVVFISGISFLGYVLFKVVGARRGIALTGVLGGVASSTAVTLSFTQRSGANPELAQPYGLAIVLAWTVMFVRVLLIIAALSQRFFAAAWIPLVAGAAVGMVWCIYLFFARSGSSEGGVALANPFELRPAIIFSLFYAAILVVANIARLWLGDAGLYLSSLVSGFADLDAITLSLAELTERVGGIGPESAARGVAIATIANTLVKGGIVLARGAPELRRAVAPAVVLIVIATGAAAVVGVGG